MIVQLALAIAIAVGAAAGQVGRDPPPTPPSGQTPADAQSLTLDDAQSLFYNARYEDAATLTLALRSADPEDMGVYELRTSALLFQLKAALDRSSDKEKAFKQCDVCQPMMASFLDETTAGRLVARARLKTNPDDESALFFLGKLNLNYVWLQLGTLGRKTGWDEYWEARRSLDSVLKRNPQHVRARVARAWIDYIVDTRMPWGTGWILGGGNKNKALSMVREAASAEAEFFVQAEAEFALWDLHVRERKLAEAVPIARSLAQDFPGNPEIAKFLEAHDPDRRR